MKANVITLTLIATLGSLARDSAICAGGGSGANSSRHIQTKAQIPSEPGEPFLIDGQIGGGIPDTERQIYKKDVDTDWSERTPALAELVDEALRRNPTTRQMWETANASAASLAAARGAYWPAATVTSTTKPSYARVPTFPGYARTTELDYNPTLQVQYLLFDFGGRKAGVNAARFNLFASEFAINQTLQTVAVGVLKSYYTLIQAKESIDIAKKSLELANGIIKDIDAASSAAKKARTELENKLKPRTPTVGATVPVAPDAQEERKKLESTQELDQQKTKIQSLDEQKQLVEPNLSSFKLGVEVARGALAAAKIQLASSVGLPGNTPLNDDTLPVSSLPGASVFSEKDFILKKEPPNLITKLTGEEDKVSKFLWKNFRSDNQEKLKKLTSEQQEQQLSILAEEFNRVVARRVSIYDEAEKPFADVKLREETRDLRDRIANGDRSSRRIMRLNRLLLEDAYPSELRKTFTPPAIEQLHYAIDDMIVEALRIRPDIANKYFSYQSARALARQADSNIYPNLTATFTGSTTAFDKTVRNDQVSGTMETNNSGRADNFLGVLTVNIPVFDALTLVNKARAARKTAAAARADLANAELNAISDVVTNFEAYTSAVKQYELAIMLAIDAADALKTAEKSYTDALTAYKMSPEERKERQKRDPCEEPQQPGKPDFCEERKMQQNLQTALNALLAAQGQLDSAATKWSLTKLSVFTSSYQLANATGALLPQYRSSANSSNALPPKPMDSR